MGKEPSIAELAIASWRLERWLDNLVAERKMAAKSALRSIKKYLEASDIDIIDPIGLKFDPGLAIEVVNNEAEDVDEEDLIIVETNSPIVKQHGAVIQYGRVILGTSIKQQKPNRPRQRLFPRKKGRIQVKRGRDDEKSRNADPDTDMKNHQGRIEKTANGSGYE